MSENKTEKKKTKKRSIIARFFKIFFLVILFLMITAFMLAGGYAYSIIKNSPPLNVEKIKNLSQTSMLFDKDGQFMDNVLNSELHREVVKSEDIPQNLKNAFVAIEDERFYTHKGIDIKRILGAALHDVKVILSGTNGGIHGASTVTQQLIKNAVLTNEVSIERKVKEMYLSIQLEQLLSKDEILTSYLNTLPMGGLQYGVQAAATRFFSKDLSDLSLIECAYLAGLTQAPTSYDALSEANQQDPSRYLNRTKTVLSKMFELGYISEEEYLAAITDIDEGKLTFNPSKSYYSLEFEWFSRPVIDQVKDDLKEKYKYTDEEVAKLIANGGLRIYSTMDRKLQISTQDILNDTKNMRNAGGVVPFATQGDATDEDGIPLLQATASIIDYRTGEVRALVGGRGNQPANSLNRAYSDLRPTGSSTKPLLVYGPAIDMKVMTAGTVYDDTSLPSSRYRALGYGAPPTNSPTTYDGYVTLREALKKSKNVTSLEVVNDMGLANSVAYGERFGLVFNDISKTSLSAAALGQFDNRTEDRDGGNVFNVGAAFGAFGNNGIVTEPILYTKVTDANGNIILENTPEQNTVISAQTAYILYDMLKGAVNYMATDAKFGNIPVAGKTGTTTKSKDYWFGGLTPYYSGAVWVGYDIPTEMRGYSGTAAYIWGKIMGVAHEGLGYKEIQSPGGISYATICKDSGKLPTDACKHDQRGDRTYTEMFLSGTAPTQLCDIHVKEKVNKLNGKLATDKTPKDLIEEKVFIKKEYSYSGTLDSKYVVPKDKDDYVPPKKEEEKEDDETQDTPPANNNKPNGGNSTNKPNGGTTPPATNDSNNKPENNTPPANDNKPD